MLTVNELLKATGGSLIRRGPEYFSGVSTDSRTIKEGEIFVALKGDNFDGHRFFQEAMKSGGGAIINRNALYAGGGLPIADHDSSGTIITVDDTLTALHRIASFLRGNFNGRVFAVVGSNGKTTTKEFLYLVLSQRFKTLKTPGNNNNHIGMPRAMTFIEPDTEHLVLEMGANRPGDIKVLCDIARPDTAVITNIGLEHLEGFGSLEGVRESELEILPYVKTVVANADDSFLMNGISNAAQATIVTYGINARQCGVRAKDITYSTEGVGFHLCCEHGFVHIQTGIYGLMNVYNCLAAAAAALTVGMPIEEIKGGLESFKGVPMRLELFKRGDILILNDCYNANPSSMQEAIAELRRLAYSNGKRRRAVAVLGDMFEIGSSGEDLHRDIVRNLNEAGVEIFIGAGAMMSKAIASFASFDGEAIGVNDAEDAAQELLRILRPGDIVLIKGSRGMKMERVAEAIKDAV